MVKRKRGNKMPTIEVSRQDLCRLIGKDLSIKELEEVILYAKGEIDSIDNDKIKIDIKDTNRPDLWSVEGIAREIKSRITNDTGLPEYSVLSSPIVIKVDEKVNKIRPLTACGVVKNLNIDENILSQIIQLQEKVAGTFGRNRKEVAIGIYDLDKIKPPIKYTIVKPDEIKFVPLDYESELTPKQILAEHEKGKEFGHLLKDCKEYPIFIDSDNNVLSMPPIINSNYSGKVTEKTKNLFIECTGFQFKFLFTALNVMVTALADRGGIIESVKIIYPNNSIITPDLAPKKTFVDVDYINKISGLNLTKKEICTLLEQARYKPELKGNKIELLYPSYRQDILHQRDIVEDVIISFGYNKITPTIPKLPTVGSIDKLEQFSNTLSEIMIGFGLQEIMSYILTNKKNLFDKMRLEQEKVVEILNPISMNFNVFRTWLLPGLLEFLSRNKHVDYPQGIFEIGDVVLIDEEKETRTRDVRKIACAITNNKVNYSEASSILDALLKNINVNYKLKKTEHKSFIQGRCAKVLINNKEIGIIGEFCPKVLENFNLETPVAGFELDLESLLNSK